MKKYIAFAFVGTLLSSPASAGQLVSIAGYITNGSLMHTTSPNGVDPVDVEITDLTGRPYIAKLDMEVREGTPGVFQYVANSVFFNIPKWVGGGGSFVYEGFPQATGMNLISSQFSSGLGGSVFSTFASFQFAGGGAFPSDGNILAFDASKLDFLNSSGSANFQYGEVRPGSIVDLYTGGINLSVDKVVLGPLAAPVPEPASWVMMIVGFGMVGGAMRLRPRLRALPA